MLLIVVELLQVFQKANIWCPHPAENKQKNQPPATHLVTSTKPGWGWESIATSLSFCGEFSLNKSCAGRTNNTWRSWARAEREQGWWAEAVCAPGWGSGTGRRRRMPPSAPGNRGGEWVPCPGWMSKALQGKCPQPLLGPWLGWGHTTGQRQGSVTGHWEIACPAEAADLAHLCPSWIP